MIHPLLSLLTLLAGMMLFSATRAQTTQSGHGQPLPIADAHVHYSHDSVELTPPERVIELMQDAGLQFALVSSSDDRGTQLLSALAPDLIVPGLRPYRRRGELGTWFKDPAALAYIEFLLVKNRYASIGEFHLYGADVDLAIPTRMVELAEQYNLVLHAHSDADAVERLLAKSDQVKVLWAHSGFAAPDEIASMLKKHDRLWTDLAFRSDVGSGGRLSDDWATLFKQFPDRIMLGTDTYTPERIYFIPEHANAARVWLSTLPVDLAEKLAWRNAHDLLMPIWNSNRRDRDVQLLTQQAATNCQTAKDSKGEILFEGESFTVLLEPVGDIKVSKPFAVNVTVCSMLPISSMIIDASMPTHGHGINYNPEITLLDVEELQLQGRQQHVHRYRAEGLVFHMPGKWQWSMNLHSEDHQETLTQGIELN